MPGRIVLAGLGQLANPGKQQLHPATDRTAQNSSALAYDGAMVGPAFTCSRSEDEAPGVQPGAEQLSCCVGAAQAACRAHS